MRSDITAFQRVLASHGATKWQLLLKEDMCMPVQEKTRVTAFSGKGMFAQYLKQEEKTERWLCKGVDVFLGTSIPQNSMLNVNTWLSSRLLGENENTLCYSVLLI